MKVDCHIHTRYSEDTLLKLENIHNICTEKGIIPLVLDHENIKGGTEYKKRFKKCIVGEEILTKQGEVIGLFMNEAIKKDLDVFETISKVHEQGALVILPHPCDKLRSSRIKEENLEAVAKKVDIIEGYNSRCTHQIFNKNAQKLAKKFNKPMSAGSDSHTKLELGNAYVEMKDFDLQSPKQFLKNIKTGKIVGRQSTFIVHPYTKTIHIMKTLFRH